MRKAVKMDQFYQMDHQDLDLFKKGLKNCFHINWLCPIFQKFLLEVNLDYYTYKNKNNISKGNLLYMHIVFYIFKNKMFFLPKLVSLVEEKFSFILSKPIHKPVILPI